MQDLGIFFEGCRYGCLAVGLCCAVYQDIRYLKITNRLNLFLLFAGLLLATTGGIDKVLDSVMGVALPLAIGFVFYALRIFGAGDVKFLMALGALMGRAWIMDCMIASILSGGVLALFVMLYRRILWDRLRYAWSYLKMLLLMKKVSAYQVLDNKQKQFFPFAIAIACGSVLASLM